MMRDCLDGEMRDLLPLLAHARLGAEEQARVAAHLARCADCTAELELLGKVAMAYSVAPVDAASIAARLPRLAPVPATTPFHRQPLWRIAASLTLAIAGVATVMLLQGRGEPGRTASTFAQEGASAGAAGPDVTVVAAASGPDAAAAGANGAFSGALADLTDAQLEALLASLERLEGNVLPDPEVWATPIVPSGLANDGRRN